MPYDWIQTAFRKADDKPCQIAPGKPGSRCKDPETGQFTSAAGAAEGEEEKKPEKKIKEDAWAAVLDSQQGKADQRHLVGVKEIREK